MKQESTELSLHCMHFFILLIDAEECKHNSAESVEESCNEDILMLDSHHENITTNVLSSIKTGINT